MRLVGRHRVLLLCAAHVTLLLTFVAMYAGLGPHLAALGLESSQTMLLRLIGLPGMFAALLVGPLSRRLSLAAIARTGVALGALGLVVEALLASTLIGTAAASLVFVIGISMAVSAMISLFGEAATPHRAGGMALNGFVLFLGASLGPLVVPLSPSFPGLLAGLAGLLVIASLCLTGHARTTRQAQAARGR
jgi:YNFM family putative membrane transporter